MEAVDEVQGYGGGDGELAAPNAVAGEHVSPVLVDDRERWAEVGERVVAAGIDVEAAGTRDVPKGAELGGLSRREHRGPREPVGDDGVPESELDEFVDLGSDPTQPVRVGEGQDPAAADGDRPAQQPVPGGGLVDTQ